jgi:hypothetical protein
MPANSGKKRPNPYERTAGLNNPGEISSAAPALRSRSRSRSPIRDRIPSTLYEHEDETKLERPWTLPPVSGSPVTTPMANAASAAANPVSNVADSKKMVENANNNRPSVSNIPGAVQNKKPSYFPIFWFVNDKTTQKTVCVIDPQVESSVLRRVQRNDVIKKANRNESKYDLAQVITDCFPNDATRIPVTVYHTRIADHIRVPSLLNYRNVLTTGKAVTDAIEAKTDYYFSFAAGDSDPAKRAAGIWLRFKEFVRWRGRLLAEINDSQDISLQDKTTALNELCEKLGKERYWRTSGIPDRQKFNNKINQLIWETRLRACEQWVTSYKDKYQKYSPDQETALKELRKMLKAQKYNVLSAAIFAESSDFNKAIDLLIEQAGFVQENDQNKQEFNQLVATRAAVKQQPKPKQSPNPAVLSAGVVGVVVGVPAPDERAKPKQVNSVAPVASVSAAVVRTPVVGHKQSGNPGGDITDVKGSAVVIANGLASSVPASPHGSPIPSPSSPGRVVSTASSSPQGSPSSGSRSVSPSATITNSGNGEPVPEQKKLRSAPLSSTQVIEEVSRFVGKIQGAIDDGVRNIEFSRSGCRKVRDACLADLGVTFNAGTTEFASYSRQIVSCLSDTVKRSALAKRVTVHESKKDANNTPVAEFKISRLIILMTIDKFCAEVSSPVEKQSSTVLFDKILLLIDFLKFAKADYVKCLSEKNARYVVNPQAVSDQRLQSIYSSYEKTLNNIINMAQGLMKGALQVCCGDRALPRASQVCGTAVLAKLTASKLIQKLQLAKFIDASSGKATVTEPALTANGIVEADKEHVKLLAPVYAAVIKLNKFGATVADFINLVQAWHRAEIFYTCYPSDNSFITQLVTEISPLIRRTVNDLPATIAAVAQLQSTVTQSGASMHYRFGAAVSGFVAAAGHLANAVNPVDPGQAQSLSPQLAH